MVVHTCLQFIAHATLEIAQWDKEVETNNKEDETNNKEDETNNKEDETNNKEDEADNKEDETNNKEDETNNKTKTTTTLPTTNKPTNHHQQHQQHQRHQRQCQGQRRTRAGTSPPLQRACRCWAYASFVHHQQKCYSSPVAGGGRPR
jgi:hypothetical protein